MDPLSKGANELTRISMLNMWTSICITTMRMSSKRNTLRMRETVKDTRDKVKDTRKKIKDRKILK